MKKLACLAVLLAVASPVSGLRADNFRRGDADVSGTIDITDAVVSLTFQFLGGDPSAAPGHQSCGIDPTPDVEGDLGCESFAPCD